MARPVLGLDFGTTNSLASYVDHEGEVRSFLNVRDARPHPSTVWYRGGEVVVGREARAHLEGSQGAVTGAFVRSPKRLLFRDSLVEIDGTQRDPVDVVAEVLRFLKEDARSPERGDNATQIDRVVLTIPVDLDGPGRKRLREAARKAGIRIEQFVHEPLAALYAWLKSQDDFDRAVEEFEGQKLLVFDWGGGTLDLTLCVIQNLQLIQLASAGDNEVGGDYFDELIANKVRELHAAQYGLDDIQAYETIESKTRLLAECEVAKIRLSDVDRSSAILFVPNYLRTDEGKHLEVEITREQIDGWTSQLINRGLAHVDRLLESQGLSPQEIALCLPTGGMVNIPTVRSGLVERFIGRVPRLENGDRIISEGAALIAADQVRLSLAKPIEILQPDGGYVQVVGSHVQLPVENQIIPLMASQFYSVDPRDGVAYFRFVRPVKVGYGAQNGPRRAYTVLPLLIDPNASPLIERLELDLLIDHDYIVTINARSTGRKATAICEIHDLEFALSLTQLTSGAAVPRTDGEGTEPDPDAEEIPHGAVQLRSNVTSSDKNWREVPGDVIGNWRSGWFDNRQMEATVRQQAERDYYQECSVCERSLCLIQLDGCGPCRIVPLPQSGSAPIQP